MNESIYQIDGLKQSYGGRTVVDVERLDIRRGEVLALVGPSGAGKSTLLRLLNFLEHPTTGSIAYGGHSLDGNLPLELRRQVTTVFQRPVLLHASVRENVIYGLRLRGQLVDGQVDAMLERVGLAGMARSAAHTLSGGEMQRVALARALVIGPQVLLLDEPTANLDPHNVTLIEDIVRQHSLLFGTTVVLVTHNVFQAKRLAHRVGLLLAGKLVELDEAHTFFESPSDPRTLAFVKGEMVY
jgi:tungstate transport system ATP-binding protein